MLPARQPRLLDSKHTRPHEVLEGDLCPPTSHPSLGPKDNPQRHECCLKQQDPEWERLF